MSKVARMPLPDPSADIVNRVMNFYANFSRDSIPLIDELYTQDVEFIDPIHRLEGSLALKAYFRNLASNMQDYEMHYLDKLQAGDSACLSWEMRFTHPQLNRGKQVRVKGLSLLKFTTRVYYHEDAYDLGALIYEQVPVLGSATRYLKKRLGN
jgi:ketosteroid isomerase-like protein